VCFAPDLSVTVTGLDVGLYGPSNGTLSVSGLLDSVTFFLSSGSSCSGLLFCAAPPYARPALTPDPPFDSGGFGFFQSNAFSSTCSVLLSWLV